MEALKFKVGDKVRVKSLEWYNSNKDANGLVYLDKQGIVFGKTMANLCGEIVQIEEVNRTGYFIYGNAGFFEDWMLEDEVIKEKRVLTKEQARDVVRNTKYRLENKNENANLQKKLFEIGIEWEVSGKAVDEDVFLLFISNNRIEFTHDIEAWVISNKKQIEPSEILSLELKEEEKPKFDPSTLQPFDKILVRLGKHSEWLARFFDFCEDDNYHTTCGSTWIMCIPYNEETKNLHGTAEDAPEFYDIWK